MRLQVSDEHGDILRVEALRETLCLADQPATRPLPGRASMSEQTPPLAA